MTTKRGPSGNGTQGDRIAALEEGYRNIGRELGGLREDFATFSRDVRGELTTRARTQWSPIIATISVVVAVLGGLITLGSQGPIREIERHTHELEEIRRHELEGAREAGADAERLRAHEHRLDRLEGNTKPRK